MCLQEISLNWSHLGSSGLDFLVEKTISQGGLFSPSCQVHFCSLIRSFHFIEAECTKAKGREGSSYWLSVYSVPSTKLGVLHITIDY